MAYQIEKTYTNFWAWISDDTDIWPENSVKDMEGIDIQTNERYATCDLAYSTTNELYPFSSAVWLKNTTNGNFVSNLSTVSLAWVTLWIGGSAWDWMASYWSGSSAEHYFFERTQGIKKTAYNGTSPSAFYTTWYPTASVAITAIWCHQANILFAKLNVVYFFSTWTSTTATAVTLRPWTEVLHIHTINRDSIVLVCKNWTETIAYELEFTGWAYNIVAESPNNDFTALGAVGNSYDVFMIATNWIWQYQGRQFTHVKYITLSWSAKVSYDKWPIIIDWSNVYNFGKKKPGRNYSLRRTSKTVHLVSNWVILENISGWFKTYAKSTAYKRTNTITLRPLDWGIYQTPKSELNYRIWFITPELNTPTPETDKCWIKIEVQTSEMKRDNSSLFVTVYESYDQIFDYIDINPNMVVDALWAYSTQFGNVTTRITLYAGDEIWSTNLYLKTPQLYDVTINANYAKTI